MSRAIVLEHGGVIAMAIPESPEDARLRKAIEIYDIANDHGIPIMTAIYMIADRMEQEYDDRR